MSAKGVVDTVMVFRILRKLTTPWEKTDAFKTGLIDKTGKIIVAKNDRTKEQKAAYTYLDRLVFNLKRLLNKVPGGKTQFASYLAALALLKEHVEDNKNEATGEYLFEKLEERKIIPKLKHDISTPEGYLDAMEEAIMAEMSSGASFGGSLSGAGSNASVNATGLAGRDPVLGKEKKKSKKKIKNVLNRL